MKPYLFLDVDGVLNQRVESSYHEYLVTVEVAKLPDSPFIKHFSDEFVDMTLRFDARYPDWLAELAEHFELVWATTWENAANEYLSGPLGLGRLPVVEHSKEPARFSYVKNGQAALWKWDSIVPFAGERALAFIDDNAGSLARWENPRGEIPTLILAPEWGLTREHVDELIAFAIGLETA
jgi:hypothetical protein